MAAHQIFQSKRQKTKSRKHLLNLFVPVDFTSPSYSALGYAIKLAKSCGGRIELFCAVDIYDLADSDNPATTRNALAAMEFQAKKKLKPIKELVAECGLEVILTEVRIGIVPDLLHAQLSSSSPDIVIVGKGTPSCAVLSSARDFTKHSVLVVPCSAKPSLPFKIVLVSDGKPINESALGPLLRIVRSGTNKLTILDSRYSKIRRLLFKYPLLLGEFDIGVTRRFKVTRSTTDDLANYFNEHKPDIICHVNRPMSMIRRIVGIFRKKLHGEQHDIPTLLIPA